MENELSDNVYLIALSSSVQLSPIDRGNMKVASIAKNIITAYGVEPEEFRNAAISAYAHSRRLVSELNNLKTEIEDLEVKLKVLKKYREVKHYGEELKALSGRAEKSIARSIVSSLLSMGKSANRFLSFTRLDISPPLKSWKRVSQRSVRSCRQ